MNLMGDLRYVTEGDVARFGSAEARAAAFAADGPLGARLLTLPIAAVVDGVAYAHGGITPAYARSGLDAMNRLVPAVLSGEAPASAIGEDSPLWFRGYLRTPEHQACPPLDEALLALGAERMVVGHTTQRSGQVASRCNGRLLGIDTGIAAHYGGNAAMVEFRSGDAWAIYPGGQVDLPDP
jgi:hypothetical protein